MSPRDLDDRARSIRARLTNELRARGQDPDVGVYRYAVERFLYRLGQSSHRERFILKGGTLVAIWGRYYRPTQDIDFTARGDSDAASVVSAVREICGTADSVDALTFDATLVSAEPIRDESEYDGWRIKVPVRIGISDFPITIDVGFGNAIVPGPEVRECRTLLGDPAPRIHVYPPESFIAEKAHAMATRGEWNTRMRDFYDLHAMADAFDFERTTLSRAVRGTFDRRRTPVTADIPVALTAPFYSTADRTRAWHAYLDRHTLEGAPRDFLLVGERIISFLSPVWSDLQEGVFTAGHWTTGGPWR